MAAVGTLAILLRAHDYGETSRILRFYTQSHGLLSVMARGVRGRGGKGGITLATFATGELTAFVKPQRDLHTMKDFACAQLRSGLGGSVLRFAGASAVAELVVAHADAEPHPELFAALEDALDDLERVPETGIATAALSGAWRIVEAFGFAPELEVCTRCGRALGRDEIGRFDFAAGGILCAECATGAAGPRVGPGARDQLHGLLSGRLDPPVTYPRRHLALLSDFVAFHVAQRPLKSLRFLGDLLPREEEAAEV
jgi:DNA repair protein RecO